MLGEGFIPKPLTALELRNLLLDALQKAHEYRSPETFHALFDHLERGLTTDDVVHALEGQWTIARSSFNKQEWQHKYEIDGSSIDGDPITIVIAVDTQAREFIVVTRWRKDDHE